jgi:hypothetical protein
VNKVPGAKDNISCNKTFFRIIYDNIGINSIKLKSCMQKLQQKKVYRIGSRGLCHKSCYDPK